MPTHWLAVALIALGWIVVLGMWAARAVVPREPMPFE